MLARLRSQYPIQKIELILDGHFVTGYRSANDTTPYESQVMTWGKWSDFFFLYKITDADFDTGYHLYELTATDSLGNQSTSRARIHFIRSFSSSFLRLPADTIDVDAGWNIVSPPFGTVPVTGVRSDLEGLLMSRFFAYNGNYVAAETLKAGAGYWVKLSAAGKLIIDRNGSAAQASVVEGAARAIAPPPAPDN